MATSGTDPPLPILATGLPKACSSACSAARGAGSAIGVEAGSTAISICAPHGTCARMWRSTASIECTGSAPRAAEQALEQAFGKPVAKMGSGGSVPLVAKLRDAYPDAQFVLWGAQDSDLARIHAANESVDISEIAGIARAEALLLQELSAG